MRDQEFLAAMNKWTPALNAKFYKLAKEANIKDDWKSFVEDLVAWTILGSFENSRRPEYAGYTCDALILLKARNVWAEYWRTRRNSFNHAGHTDLDVLIEKLTDTPLVSPPTSKIDMLFEQADEEMSEILRLRLENYGVDDIAGLKNKTPGSISMQIQRFKKKVLERL